jgi:mercuric ion binding protein
MKRIFTLLLFIFVASFTFVDANAGSEKNHKATFKIEKMTCATCPITVRKAMQRVDGVKEVTVDFDSKTATVIYDASLTNTKQIAFSSSNVGFPTSLIEESTE